MARHYRCIVFLIIIFSCLTTFVFITKLNAQPTVTSPSPSIDQPYPSKIAKLGAPEQQLTEARSPVPAVSVDDVNLLLQPARPHAEQAAADWWWRTFQSNRSGNWEIYRVRETSGDVAQLTLHPAADTQPRLNRGASTIVFVSARDGNPELYRMNADGSNQIRLTNHPLTDTHPSWSPDSSLISFVSTRDGNAELYQLNADGSGLRRLTTDPALDLFPSWSPDGQQLVWVRATGDHGWLWMMNRDGSNARAVSGPLRYLQHPVWSPDGSEIAFDYDPDNDYFNELGLFTLANGTITLFGDASEYPPPYPSQDVWMGDWVPNGRFIYYTGLRYLWQPVGHGYIPIWEEAEIILTCRKEPCYFGARMASAGTPFNLLPSIQSADAEPPRTAVDPLPTYRRRTPLFVTWSGTDRGPSGIAGYDLQVRSAESDTWQDWLRFTYVIGHSLDLAMSEGVSTLYFRSRGIDQAENEEAWPAAPTGDTGVTFYAATLRGRVTDLRGIGRPDVSLPLLPAALNPAVTDGYGDYFVRLPTSGEYQINGLRINTDADRVQPFYLDPPQNLIKNGDFESFIPLEHWQGGGSITPTLTISQVSSGLQGVQLGFDCRHACVTVDPQVTFTNTQNHTPLWTPDGSFHLFYDSYIPNDADGDPYHQRRSPTGEWSLPEKLAAGNNYSRRVAGDAQGNLLVAWMIGAVDAYKVATMAYSPQTGWGPPVPLDLGESPQVAMGGDGSQHLFYLQRCAPDCWRLALLYRWRTATGAWSPAITVNPAGDDNYRIFASSDGVAHLLWHTDNTKYHNVDTPPRLLYYQTYRQGKPMSTPRLLDDQWLFTMPYLDPQGKLVLFGTGNESILYTRTPLAHAGSESEAVIAGWKPYVAWGADGALHLFSPDDWANKPWRYRFQGAGQQWSTLQSLPLGGRNPEGLAVDVTGQIQAITQEGDFIQFPPKIAAGQSTLSQAVTLPTTLHEPTLSWLVETQGRHHGQSSFQVRVSAGVTQTVLYSTTAAQPLALHWADMTPWLGQRVTVTFAISQAAAEIPFRALLDHVALGPWETPAPAAVDPAQVAASVSTSIIISGANFIATPQVTLAGKPLTNVRLLSATALAATIPATVGPGIHDLVVTNPGGIATVLPNAVKVGQQLYLPAVQR